MKISVNPKFHFLYDKDKLDKYRDCVLEDVESGLPKVRIARKYGCNVSTLYDWLKKQGVWP